MKNVSKVRVLEQMHLEDNKERIMQICSNFLKVLCEDDKGNRFEIPCLDYEENYDEIKVRTQFNTTDLKRGWIGNLFYQTQNNKCLETGSNVDECAEHFYINVLLAKVNIWSSDDVITWQYTFLKE